MEKGKKNPTASVNALYGQRICRLTTCKKPFKAVRKDQVFCRPAHRQEYYNKMFEIGKRVVAQKEAKERMKKVRIVTQDMPSKERLAALVETAQAVFNRHMANSPRSPFGEVRNKKVNK